MARMPKARTFITSSCSINSERFTAMSKANDKRLRELLAVAEEKKTG
jgi:hypothetical protein